MKKYLPFILIIAAGLSLFIPNLSNTSLFDWDEINFAEAAREMIVNGDYSRVTINFLPFWEKPPLFLWMQALCMNVLGINEFAARLPNAIFGIITLLTLFVIGKKHFGEKMAWLWVIIYTGTLLPQFYFMMGMIDPVFNYFIFLGIYFLFRFSTEGRYGTEENKSKNLKLIMLAGLFTGLAILTKGPVAFLIAALIIIVFWIIKRKVFSIKFFEILTFIVIAFIVSTLWFGFETIRNGFFFLREFFVYQVRLFSTQDAGHGGPFYYHFVVILFGLFPASILAIMGFRKYFQDSDNQKYFHTWMVILFWVVLILFSIVKTKIIHYSSLAYFPVTFLAAYYLNNVILKKIEWKRWIDWVIVIFGFLITLVVIAFPVLFLYRDRWIDKVTDGFTFDLIMKPVVWTGFETITYVLFFIGIIVFIVLRKKLNNGFYAGIIIMFILSTLGINITLKTLAPKLESHLQKDIVEFYKSIEDKDVYCDVIGYKSYAQLFYTYKNNPVNKNSLNNDWLISGNIDKPVYFVTKSSYRDRMDKNYPYMKFIKKVGGYLVYLRDTTTVK